MRTSRVFELATQVEGPSPASGAEPVLEDLALEALRRAGVLPPDAHGSPELRTAIRAALGDLDRDGRLDVDLDALATAANLDLPSDAELTSATDHVTGPPLEGWGPVLRPLRFQRTLVPPAPSLDARRLDGPNYVSGILEWRGVWEWNADTEALTSFDDQRSEGTQLVDRLVLEVHDDGHTFVQLFHEGAPVDDVSARITGRIQGYAEPVSPGAHGLLLDLLADPRVEAATPSRATPLVEAMLGLRRWSRLMAPGASGRDWGEQAVLNVMRLPLARRRQAEAEARGLMGVEPRRYFGFIDGPEAAGFLQQLHEASRPELGVTAERLFVSAMAEGMALYVQDVVGPNGPRLDQPVDGFRWLGADTFSGRVASLKRRGLLRDSFLEGADFVPRWASNEKGQSVHTAVFADLARGLEAHAALFADARRTFLHDATERFGEDRVAELTDAQEFYFATAYYNGGAGRMRSALDTHGLDWFRAWTGPEPSHWNNLRFNATKKTATYIMVESAGIFR